MAVNDKHSLPGYSNATVRVASNLGGGVAGWGDICGAIIGGTMAIGLLIGTNGDEPIPKFDEMRLRERKIRRNGETSDAASCWAVRAAPLRRGQSAAKTSVQWESRTAMSM